MAGRCRLRRSWLNPLQATLAPPTSRLELRQGPRGLKRRREERGGGAGGGGRNFPAWGLWLPHNSFCLRRERGNGKGGEAVASTRCAATGPGQTPRVRGHRGRPGLICPLRSRRRASLRSRSPRLQPRPPPDFGAPAHSAREGRSPAAPRAVGGPQLERPAFGGERRPQVTQCSGARECLSGLNPPGLPSGSHPERDGVPRGVADSRARGGEGARVAPTAALSCSSPVAAAAGSAGKHLAQGSHAATRCSAPFLLLPGSLSGEPRPPSGQCSARGR